MAVRTVLPAWRYSSSPLPFPLPPTMLAHHPPPPPYRAGTILGWAPSDDSHDYAYTTTATTSSYPPPPPYEGPSLAYVSDLGSAQSYIPRSLSLDSAVRPRSEPDAHDTSSSYTVYDNPTSMRRYKIKRSQDPTWAPRPPNAFILFRRDYVNRHKGENIVAETKQQQKTLSKRASDAWKSAEDDERQVWYEKAKLEALKHAAAHPDYVFRPKKRRIEARRHPAMLSRREQVEEFVRKSTRRRAVAIRPRAPVHLESHTPGSARSSASPEPPCTPSSEESNPLSNDVPTGLQSRSDSLPARFDYPDYFPPMQNRSYMSQAAMLSMPSLVSERPLALKRSFSHSDMQPYSPWDYVNLGDDYSESDDQSIFSFDSVGGEPSPAAYGGEHSDQPSPLHTPEGHFMPEPQHISTPLEMPEPLVMPSVDPATMMLPSTSVAPPPSSPFSNAADVPLPSPPFHLL
ncbi:hypothetical protein C2E23DRAFT_278656 [Lenzites betulinus]|nr:hypothetical protein C2E23DRAFT_278656 [Lenzites betulinus]